MQWVSGIMFERMVQTCHRIEKLSILMSGRIVIELFIIIVIIITIRHLHVSRRLDRTAAWPSRRRSRSRHEVIYQAKSPSVLYKQI